GAVFADEDVHRVGKDGEIHAIERERARKDLGYPFSLKNDLRVAHGVTASVTGTTAMSSLLLVMLSAPVKLTLLPSLIEGSTGEMPASASAVSALPASA